RQPAEAQRPLTEGDEERLFSTRQLDPLRPAACSETAVPFPACRARGSAESVERSAGSCLHRDPSFHLSESDFVAGMRDHDEAIWQFEGKRREGFSAAHLPSERADHFGFGAPASSHDRPAQPLVQVEDDEAAPVRKLPLHHLDLSSLPLIAEVANDLAGRGGGGKNDRLHRGTVALDRAVEGVKGGGLQSPKTLREKGRARFRAGRSRQPGVEGSESEYQGEQGPPRHPSPTCFTHGGPPRRSRGPDSPPRGPGAADRPDPLRSPRRDRQPPWAGCRSIWRATCRPPWSPRWARCATCRSHS